MLLLAFPHPSADLLRDLGVFSLLRVSPETSEHGIVGGVAAPDEASGAAGGGEIPRMGCIPAPERPVILDLLDVEVFGFSDLSGNFLTNERMELASPKPATPGKDVEGWF